MLNYQYVIGRILIKMHSHLYLHGAKNFALLKLGEKRKIGIIENYTSFSGMTEKFKEIIDYEKFDYVICHKENTEGFFMKWHLDDAKVIDHNKNKSKVHDQIYITETKALYYKKKPIFSLIVYESDYNIDFTGGTLEFIDGTTIYPKKGMYVLFDSNELHKVNIIKSGIRSAYLIKFYAKE